MSRFEEYLSIIQEMQTPATNTIGILNFLKKVVEMQQRDPSDRFLRGYDDMTKLGNLFNKYFSEQDLKDFISYCVQINRGNVDDVLGLILKQPTIKKTADTLYPLLYDNREKVAGIIVNKIKDLMKKKGMDSFIVDRDTLKELSSKL
jgi:hypothetical protein